MILKLSGTGQNIWFPLSGTFSSALVGKADGTVPALAGAATDGVALGQLRVTLAAADCNVLGPITIWAYDALNNNIGQWFGVVLADYPSTGDPMAASVPGAYSPGQAGFLIGSALATLSGVLPATANAAIGVEVLDKANGIETGLTVRQALRLIAASLTGKLAIVGSTVTIKGAGVNTDRVSATTDAIGQRTAVTLTP